MYGSAQGSYLRMLDLSIIMHFGYASVPIVHPNHLVYHEPPCLYTVQHVVSDSLSLCNIPLLKIQHTLQSLLSIQISL